MQLTTELDTHPTWLKPIRVGFGPRYLQVVRMIKDGISNGSLPPGTQIPTQRRLAQLLDIDVSTVSRAYASAHKQGLISGTTGRGTFIAEQETENFGYPGSDLGLNTPLYLNRYMQHLKKAWLLHFKRIICLSFQLMSLLPFMLPHWYRVVLG